MIGTRDAYMFVWEISAVSEVYVVHHVHDILVVDGNLLSEITMTNIGTMDDDIDNHRVPDKKTGLP